MLSHSYWKTRFGGDPKIVGQVFQMNDRPHTVIGVLPPVPLYPQECDVYMPTIACPFRARGEERMAANRRAFGALQVFGRLKPGVDAGACGAAGGDGRRALPPRAPRKRTRISAGSGRRRSACWAS